MREKNDRKENGRKSRLDRKYRGFLLAGIMILALMALAACGSDGEGTDGNGQTDGKGYTKLTAEEAYNRMTSGDDVVVVDVRTQEEYEEKHIEGALLIPNETIGEEMPGQLPDKDAEILIYCRSGNRSQQAAEKLIAMGYTKVFDFGGINDWPYDTVSGPAPDNGGTDGIDGTDGEGAGDAADGGAGADESGDKGDPSFSNFTATDIDGNKVDESIFSGYDLTMVNLWGTFCSPCIREMPDLGEINRDYGGKDVQIVGIMMDVLNQDLSVSEEQIETAREIIDKTKADYIHLIPSMDLLMAGVGSVQSIPFTFFVDKDGTIVGKTYSGSKSKSKWESIIKDTLKEVQ